MNFRPLTISDLDAVMTLERSLPNSASWEPASVDNQASIINNGNNFGVFEGDTLIGKVGFWDTKTEGWEVDGMIISTTHRGKKYGGKLFDYALLAIIDKVNPDILTLYTHPDNRAAVSIYTKRGFIEQGIVKDKYGPGKHRLKFIKKLR